jgi:hypothetical protein
MLWYKAWLETRWRVAFWLVCTAGLLFLPKFLNAPPKAAWVGFQLQSVLMGCFVAIYLAGSGINTQTLYGATSGFHPSMLFTLSLPVSRRQLLLARAGLGALETCVLVLLNEWITLSFRPAATSLSDSLRYGLRTVLCTMAVYALSVFAACILDEMWQFTGVALALVILSLIQSRSHVVALLSPLRGMNLMSVPITAPLPWPSLLTSAAMILVLLWLSIMVVERREY